MLHLRLGLDSEDATVDAELGPIGVDVAPPEAAHLAGPGTHQGGQVEVDGQFGVVIPALVFYSGPNGIRTRATTLRGGATLSIPCCQMTRSVV